MDRIDCVVIGAGVIGLAIARALAFAGRDVVVIERERAIGSATSSRNSEVIHAGIYYPSGSLKASTCFAGRESLYAFCETHNVAHRRCGKLIVAASDAQLSMLEAIAATGLANGVDDLHLLDRTAMRSMEPELQAVAALHSPSTGIVDSHALMLALLAELESNGGVLALDTLVTALRRAPDGIDVHVDGAIAPALRADAVINAAGLGAQSVAALIEDFPAAHLPALRLAKGSYFTLGRRAPFSRLIYPVPQPGGLGIHLTLDLGGAARFGPDVEWVDAIDYDVNPGRVAGFYEAIRSYWPGLRDGDLHPGYAGIRPKLASGDFVISGPAEHGIAGLVNLFGIESPGLTASLALADRVAALLAERV